MKTIVTPKYAQSADLIQEIFGIVDAKLNELINKISAPKLKDQLKERAKNKKIRGEELTSQDVLETLMGFNDTEFKRIAQGDIDVVTSLLTDPDISISSKVMFWNRLQAVGVNLPVSLAPA